MHVLHLYIVHLGRDDDATLSDWAELRHEITESLCWVFLTKARRHSKPTDEKDSWGHKISILTQQTETNRWY